MISPINELFEPPSRAVSNVLVLFCPQVVHLRQRLDSAVSSSRDRPVMPFEASLSLIQTLIDCDEFQDIATLRVINNIFFFISSMIIIFLAEFGRAFGPQERSQWKIVPDRWLNSLQAGAVDQEVAFLPGIACRGKLNTQLKSQYINFPFFQVHTRMLTHKWHELLVLTTSAYQAIHGKPYDQETDFNQEVKFFFFRWSKKLILNCIFRWPTTWALCKRAFPRWWVATSQWTNWGRTSAWWWRKSRTSPSCSEKCVCAWRSTSASKWSPCWTKVSLALGFMLKCTINYWISRLQGERVAASWRWFRRGTWTA